MTPRQMIFTALPGMPIIHAGDDLGQLILEGLARAGIVLENGDVLILAQKIVSKAEGREVRLEQVRLSEEARSLAARSGKDPRLVELILRESRKILRQKGELIIAEHRLGFICANAGIDRSNVGVPDTGGDPRVLLLPEDPDASAARIRRRLKKASSAEIGVLIIDSHGRAWRRGTVGVCIGVAGFPALQDLRGRSDLFGRRLEITQVGLADEIAAGASALMGQADEGVPAIHLRGLPYPLREASLAEILRPEEEDLFR